MVTHIAGPHFTLEGPDFLKFLFFFNRLPYLSRLYCEILLTERFFQVASTYTVRHSSPSES
jgi:hypothetical protein